MASHNVVFAIDVDYRSEDHNVSKDKYQNYLKQWISRFLLTLGTKYGFEKVRWGYRFFHSRMIKNGSIITSGTDFKELHEKVFSDFEEELLAKFADSEKTPEEQHKVQHSQASCVQNTLKEILLDFQWDRPDITSPTKLRPRRSIRNTKNISLADDELSYLGKNVLFVVSECPHTKRDLEEFLTLRSGDSESYKDLLELVLPKRLIDMIIQRNVVLHWADSSYLKVNNGAGECMGLRTIMEVLQLVAGKVVPMLTPCLALNHTHPNMIMANEEAICAFPTGSTTGYILSSEKTYQRAFPALVGTLCWGADEDQHTCSVSFEPVSCGQKLLCEAPVEVMLRSVLHGLDTCSFRQLASECWLLLCPDKPERDQESFQCLLKELSVQACDMLAEVSEGGRVHSAVLSVLSPHTALLTVLQPLVTQSEEVVGMSLISSQTTDDALDLPDVVSSVLNVMYDIMKDDESSEDTDQHEIPDWANQELQQQTNLKTDLTEGWFPLSDQSGISCHLMESIRHLHAAPEEQEQREFSTELELTHSLAEFYQNSTAGPSTGPKGKKRGAQRTPVRQKMKSMSRSLQMLNFARFSVKAQKSRAETDSGSAARAVKRSTRGTGRKTPAGVMHFKSEEELLSHLKLSYQQAVEDKSVPLLTQVQGLLSLVTTFMKSNTNAAISFSDLIKMNLLKSAQSVRQIYGSAPDIDSKIRDCQLQVVLRLELCKQSFSAQGPGYVEDMVEEMADMLRIISLTNDPVYLSKFMKEEVLSLYLNGIPKVLAEVYHSLGTQLPEELAAVLPPDFFSDDSMAKESVSVSPSAASATQSLGSNAGDRLEELRSRSAKKRRTSILTRHKSMTEASQSLRQIEMPRKSSRQAKPTMCVPSEKFSVGSQPLQKQAVQEVTKVRRNLFNQETMSPLKKAKMPRSQSVSAVEGLKKRKRSQMEDERHSLLTKKVSETPLHKQVSNRLLHRQKSGRRPGETDMLVVEESPVKPTADLRRSPRIKNLARRHSSVFYSSSQSRSRNLDRALSSSQLGVFEGKGGINVNSVKSPMRLLFGAAQSPGCPSKSSKETRNIKEIQLGSPHSGFETFNKTPRKSPYNQSGSAVGSRIPQTPRTPPSPRAKGSFFPKSPGYAIGDNGMVLRGSPFRSPPESLVLETPKKTPLKGILRTPVKSFMDCDTISGPSLRSPNVKTPRKSVTWSPAPQKYMSEKTFKVPESSQSSNRCSPRLLTPIKFCPDQADVFKTPEKLSQRKFRMSPELAQRGSELTENKEPHSIQSSDNTQRTLSLPEKIVSQSPGMLSIDHPSAPTSEIKTPKKIPGPSHRMYTDSGRTPPKCSPTASHYKATVLLSSGPLPNNGCLPMKDKPSKRILRSHTSGNHMFDSTSCPSTSSNCSKFNQALDGEPQTVTTVERQNESIHEMTEEGSSSDTQLDSLQFSGTTTEESIDIEEASVVKTELCGGVKMNIAYSRKSSRHEVFEFTDLPAETPQGCNYGFRQTPDRQQRKAAARLGYSPGLPVFSTPWVSGKPTHRKKTTVEPNPLTYQVELEMQASGLPKLKFKRTDSFNLGEAADYVAKNLTPHMNTKTSRVDSPLAHCSTHREPSCVSPSLCAHGTPGKGGVQTYICRSITPTRPPTNSPSPLGPVEHMPWTPSPQKRGWSTPENFSRWPRKKRARTGMLETKEHGIKGKCDILDNPEFDGVFRLQGEEEIRDSKSAPAFKHALGIRSRLCTPEEIDWSESVVQSYDKKDAVKYEDLSLKSGKGSVSSVVTPPNSKVKKSVSVSGILALTQSPLLYKGRKGSVTKETGQADESVGNVELHSKKSVFMLDVSPSKQPRRHQRPSRTYSRKRLLDS